MSEDTENQINSLPPDWWQHASVIDVLINQFKKHIIGLFIGGLINGQYNYFLYTGFLVNYNNELLWLTAGHVIDNISEVTKSPQFTLTKIFWLDDYGIPGAEFVPVYYPQKMRKKSWTSDELDFGVIALPELEKQSILSNKNVNVMNHIIWKNLKYASPEGYYVVGYPRAWNNFEEQRLGGNKVLRSIKTNIACLPLIPANPPPESEQDPFWKNKSDFFGQIIKYPDIQNFDVDELSGISGGPILSIERTPELQFKYRLAGIQVGWKSDIKVVRAEPIDKIASALDDWLSSNA